MKHPHNLKILLTLALFIEVCYLGIAVIDELQLHVIRFLLLYGVVGGLYWMASRRFFGLRGSTRRTPAGANHFVVWVRQFMSGADENRWKLSTASVLLIGMIFGVFFRVTLINTSPSLSEDIYRYVWDGKVAANGINPFGHPPESEVLSSIRDDVIYPQINHKGISTVYPPVLQQIFLNIYKIKPELWAFKAAFVFFDLLTACIIIAILAHYNLPREQVLLYFWNPLLVVEIAGSGHAEPVGIFFLMLALLLAIKRKTLWGNVALVLSFLTKFLAILFLPALALRKKENKYGLVVAFIVLACVCYLPYSGAGSNLFSGLMTYGSKWEFNGSIFWAIKAFFQEFTPDRIVASTVIYPFGMSPDPETLMTRRVDFALYVTKLIVSLTFLRLLVVRLRRNQKEYESGGVQIFRDGLTIIGIFILLNPTIHPWYICWILPFLAIVPALSWTLLSITIMLSYWILTGYAQTGIWEESNVVRILEYAPFYLLLIFERIRFDVKA
jgi:hypothetical protein